MKIIKYTRIKTQKLEMSQNLFFDILPKDIIDKIYIIDSINYSKIIVDSFNLMNDYVFIIKMCIFEFSQRCNDFIHELWFRYYEGNIELWNYINNFWDINYDNFVDEFINFVISDFLFLKKEQAVIKKYIKFNRIEIDDFISDISYVDYNKFYNQNKDETKKILDNFFAWKVLPKFNFYLETYNS